MKEYNRPIINETKFDVTDIITTSEPSPFSKGNDATSAGQVSFDTSWSEFFLD